MGRLERLGPEAADQSVALESEGKRRGREARRGRDEPQAASRPGGDRRAGAGQAESDVDGVSNPVIDALAHKARRWKRVHGQAMAVDDQGAPAGQDQRGSGDDQRHAGRTRMHGGERHCSVGGAGPEHEQQGHDHDERAAVQCAEEPAECRHQRTSS